ncbi:MULTISPECIES: ATP-grasp domain-containing protein [Providencia]|uniref:ATP-grasp domain-containing protein n=1 Tax=Providencia stuartii TaxID=588 RepID=A0ABD5L3W7_PROST|nr:MULTISPECIES: ATP-grasp domain-containing protein [Providencia]ELR5046261.1 ATP-grasp domain-containing protein [Providencia rettgeri]ELR5291463.1 ATP-grasp domain-containing protein [Providencia stuartii]MCR4180552.1 ATP-grasp domain-containing protein [Providencia vermicola]QIC17217.1 ATP-grasp domain-containing protein [Providencia vermicola]URE78135.1 ATP-grasp domain-containing protein [Providencia stuartii]
MKAIIFLECNLSGTGVRAIQIAKNAGYQTILLTKQRSFYEHIADNPLNVVDHVAEVNTDSLTAVINHAMNYPTYGIVAFDDYRLITAAAASHALGLPSPPIKPLVLCRYKQKTRERLSQYHQGFQYHVINIKDTIDTSNLSFPLVVKPCDDSGSSKVTICHTPIELTNAIQEICHFRVNQRGYELSSDYLIEEFIHGDEYSAEAYWDTSSNQWEILGITKKYTTTGQYSVEVGHDFPCELPSYPEIKTTLISWLKHIGLSHTVVHVEFKLQNDSITLIEINPRVAGGMIDKLCQIATGFDLVHCYLSQFVKDMEYTPQLTPEKCYASIRFLTADKAGIINSIKPTFLSSQPLLSNFVPTPLKVGSLKDSYSRLGYVITHATTQEKAIADAETYIKQIKITYA